MGEDRFRPRGQDFEANLTVSIEDLVNREPKSLSLQVPDVRPDGTMAHKARTFQVRIPPGATEGTRIRLSGQGHAGGNLYLNLHVAPHPLFRLNGHDLDLVVPIAPWEAVLGAKVRIPTLEGRPRWRFRRAPRAAHACGWEAKASPTARAAAAISMSPCASPSPTAPPRAKKNSSSSLPANRPSIPGRNENAAAPQPGSAVGARAGQTHPSTPKSASDRTAI